MKKKMFNGSLPALIVFLVSMGMAVTLFLSAIIVGAVGNRSLGGSGSYTTLYTGSYYYFYSGTNQFTFTPSSTDDYEIYLESSSDISRVSKIVVKNSSGTTVKTITSPSTYNKLSLSAHKTYYITITATGYGEFYFRYY